MAERAVTTLEHHDAAAHAATGEDERGRGELG